MIKTSSPWILPMLTTSLLPQVLIEHLWMEHIVKQQILPFEVFQSHKSTCDQWSLWSDGGNKSKWNVNGIWWDLHNSDDSEWKRRFSCRWPQGEKPLKEKTNHLFTGFWLPYLSCYNTRTCESCYFFKFHNMGVSSSWMMSSELNLTENNLRLDM